MVGTPRANYSWKIWVNQNGIPKKTLDTSLTIDNYLFVVIATFVRELNFV